MMEKLLQYVWRHRLFPLGDLTTTDGFPLEVIDPGQQNTDAGPDFFNAKIKINGTLWVGNVEVHLKSSLWYAHNHHTDKNYNNVVLHVAEVIDTDVQTEAGDYPPQLCLTIPPALKDNYIELLNADRYPPCYKIIPSLTSLMVHSWMSVLQTERLEEKTKRIFNIVERCAGDWERTYFVTLCRNFGFGINSDAFERYAIDFPLSSVAHHRDDMFQVEAIFLGQSGLLDRLDGDYAERLKKEYTYLRHKFSLTPENAEMWRFLRLRPNNFPYVRISQLANLYYEGRTGLSQLLECGSLKEVRALYATHATPVLDGGKHLSASSIDVLIINTAVPILFAYGRHKGKNDYCERALTFLDEMKGEKNHILTTWQECGLDVRTAGDSQALIQLKKEYCDKKDCLRCRIGYEFLKGRQQSK